jgi:hypothetical protein
VLIFFNVSHHPLHAPEWKVAGRRWSESCATRPLAASGWPGSLDDLTRIGELILRMEPHDSEGEMITPGWSVMFVSKEGMINLCTHFVAYSTSHPGPH